MAGLRAKANTNNPEADSWGEYLILPENRSAVRVAKQLLRALAHPTRPSALRSGPVLLHGPPGTGKSALLTTLVQFLIRDDRTSGQSIRSTQALELPKKSGDSDDNSGPDEYADYLLSDLLIVEDLQFLPDKHVISLCKLIDYRISHRRPTILTATAGPAGLRQFSRRLTSRLAAGLSIRLDLPGLASRKQLCRVFAEHRRLRLEPTTIEWIAEQSHGGVRAVLGAIEQLRGLSDVARGQLEPLGLSQVQQWLNQNRPNPDEGNSPLDRITDRVASAFGVKATEIRGQGRQRTVALARQVAMYLARLVAKLPLTRIGSYFGGRDHSTVLHALQKMEITLKSDSELAGKVREIKAELC